MTLWQLHEAKNKLSELIDRALSEGPQVITRHGVEVVVVMPFVEYQESLASKPKLGDFFLNSPLRDSGLVLERDRATALREIDL